MQIREPLKELRETRLFQYLRGRSDDHATAIERFLAEVAPILATTIRFFPHYTRHDAHHGYRVVRRIEQILAPWCLECEDERSLQATEVYLLIASAYAHDLGMTVFPGEEDELLKQLDLKRNEGWETDPKLQRHLRENHSRRGGEYIHSHAKRLGVPINLVHQLNWMMMSHNLSIPELEQKLRDPFAADERVVDLRQLSVLLCIADAIEFSDTRVVEGVLDSISADDSPDARTSYRENMKHICIGDSLAIDGDGRIIVSGTFCDADVLSLAHHTFDQIEGWIRGYCDMERRSSPRRLRVRPESLHRRLELGNGRFERLGVRISKKNVIDLIASNAIWNSSIGIPIRELTQNAVEACRYRHFHSPGSERYEANISVSFDRSARTVTINDNGCGMSERVVLNNLLTVGSSRAREPGYTRADYAPIAQFGVGFWSVFTIAERAVVETAPFEGMSESHGISFEVALGDLKDYIVFHDRVMPAGTMITLHLKPEVVIDEIFERSRELVVCCEVKLSLALDGQEYTVPFEVPAILPTDIVGSRTQLIDSHGLRFFNWRGVFEDTEVAVGFAYFLRDGRPAFELSPEESVQLAIGGFRSPKTMICGFDVRLRPSRMCFELFRVGILRANHRSPRSFEFSIDRTRLISNDASLRFSRAIGHLVHNAFRAFLRENHANNPEIIFSLNEQSALHGGNVFDVFTETELTDAFVDYPDLLCFRLFEVSEGVTLPEPRFVDLRTLAQMHGTVWMLQNHLTIPIGGGRYRYLPPEACLYSVYEYASAKLISNPSLGPMYVMDANRPASMLFDADPESSVEFTKIPSIGTLCLQRVALGNIRFGEVSNHILTEVRGRWSGAVYLRDFQTPDTKPYVFLGRSRVLIRKSSRLQVEAENLKLQGRLSKLAELILMLDEDQKGFTPAGISHLLVADPL